MQACKRTTQFVEPYEFQILVAYVFQFTEIGPNGQPGRIVKWGQDQHRNNPEPGPARTRASSTEDCIVPEITTSGETV
jgi:hypothetical protein